MERSGCDTDGETLHTVIKHLLRFVVNLTYLNALDYQETETCDSLA